MLVGDGGSRKIDKYFLKMMQKPTRSLLPWKEKRGRNKNISADILSWGIQYAAKGKEVDVGASQTSVNL